LKNRAGRFLLAALVVVQVSKGPVARYSAVADNVNNAGENVRIDILAWSSDTDRDQMVAAWNLTLRQPEARRVALPGPAPLQLQRPCAWRSWWRARPRWSRW
jgi:hypothetical protein